MHPSIISLISVFCSCVIHGTHAVALNLQNGLNRLHENELCATKSLVLHTHHSIALWKGLPMLHSLPTYCCVTKSTHICVILSRYFVYPIYILILVSVTFFRLVLRRSRYPKHGWNKCSGFLFCTLKYPFNNLVIKRGYK